MTDFPAPPTEEESMRIAERFLDAAMVSANEGPEKGIALVESFFDCAPVEAGLRVWYWVAVGPILTAAAINKLNKRPPEGGEFWAIESLPGAKKDENPAALAAMQCVVAHLNGDADLAHDVTTARFAVAGHDGLFEMVCEFLVLCAFLTKQGAFQ